MLLSRKFYRFLLPGVLAGMLLSEGCIKPPDYPLEPVIEFLSISTDSIVQYDTISMTMKFTDGDGDLGFQLTDTAKCNQCPDLSPSSGDLISCFDHPTINMFLIDSRTGCLQYYNVPYIPPKGSSKAISGEIQFSLLPICCLPPSGFPCQISEEYPEDTLYYTIYLKDRAGHLSDTIQSPPIYVNCTKTI